jgi:hypothetical protein
MNTTVTYLAAQEHIKELRREARQHDLARDAQQHDLVRETEQRPSPVKFRRVAIIRPHGSHFRLTSIQH